VLVEGYFDAIALHQAGVRNALALCSTALTPGQLALLARLEAKELVLLLDGDDAGRRAVERLAGPILNAAANCRVAVLPEGFDPDTFTRKAGAEAVQKLLHDAPTLTQHLFKSTLPDGPAASFEDKMAALERLKPITAQIPVGLVRSAFFGAMARHFGLPAQELEAALRSKAAPPVRAVPRPAASSEPAPDPLEATWAACVLRDRGLLLRDEHRVIDELKHLGLRALVASIQQGRTPEDALYDASEVLKKALQKATDFLPADPAALEQAFGQVCRRLKLRSVEERLQRIARETAKVPGASSELTQDSRDLLEERGQLLDLKRRLLSQK
jgi:DNA primase